jgi:hypothetical protein
MKSKPHCSKRTLTVPERFCFDPDQSTILDFEAAASVTVGYFGLRFAVAAVQGVQSLEWFSNQHL